MKNDRSSHNVLGYFFPRLKSRINFDKNALGYNILGDFLTNSYGHPGEEPPSGYFSTGKNCCFKSKLSAHKKA
jgi:hypothetical protein